MIQKKKKNSLQLQSIAMLTVWSVSIYAAKNFTNNDFHIQGSDVHWTQSPTSEQTADYAADTTL